MSYNSAIAEMNCPSVFMIWRNDEEQSSKNLTVYIDKPNKSEWRKYNSGRCFYTSMPEKADSSANFQLGVLIHKSMIWFQSTPFESLGVPYW